MKEESSSLERKEVPQALLDQMIEAAKEKQERGKDYPEEAGREEVAAHYGLISSVLDRLNREQGEYSRPLQVINAANRLRMVVGGKRVHFVATGDIVNLQGGRFMIKGVFPPHHSLLKTGTRIAGYTGVNSWDNPLEVGQIFLPLVYGLKEKH